MKALDSVREEIERMKAEAKIDTDMDSGLELRVRAIRDEAKQDAARRELDELKRRLKPSLFVPAVSAPREIVIPRVEQPATANG
jgi:phage shock protein A